jgi:hypothetical protein
MASPAPIRWENLEDRADRCPQCLHWWVSHGVPGEDGYACSMPTSSMDERERGIYEVCGCTLAEGNTVTPRQVRIWTDGTSWPLAPWERDDCSHRRRGPIEEDGSQQCLDCGVDDENIRGAAARGNLPRVVPRLSNHRRQPRTGGPGP